MFSSVIQQLINCTKNHRQTFVNLFRVWFWFRFGALLLIAWKLDRALTLETSFENWQFYEADILMNISWKFVAFDGSDR